MGVVGKYLDLLPPPARDRILTGQRWFTRAYADIDGTRSLLGYAEDWWWSDPQSIPVCRALDVFALRAAAGDELWSDCPLIHRRFARLAERRGLETAVALVRARLNGTAAPVTRVRRHGHLVLVG